MDISTLGQDARRVANEFDRIYNYVADPKGDQGSGRDTSGRSQAYAAEDLLTPFIEKIEAERDQELYGSAQMLKKYLGRLGNTRNMKEVIQVMANIAQVLREVSDRVSDARDRYKSRGVNEDIQHGVRQNIKNFITAIQGGDLELASREIKGAIEGHAQARYDEVYEDVVEEGVLMSVEDIASGMIKRYGGVEKALEWAELHRAANMADKNDPATKHWQAIKDHLKDLQRQVR